MANFYITTPLYYVNDKPHIGHAYSTIMADVLKRYHQLFGDDTFMLTGTDEHGQKVQQAAEKRGLTPQAHCDDMYSNFKTTWHDLNINYDLFFRTTTDWHKQAVQKCLKDLFDRGEIYEDTYEGWYSVSEEIFYTEKELINGKSPSGKEVTKITEKNYFFRMSKYQEQLIQYIHDHPQFIQPDVRKNEVLGFLKKPLQDLCISRPKARMSWGIELPFDTDYVTYVWFDALLNYATGVGYQRDHMQDEFDKWWNQAGAIHIIGKDIITTHAVYWTTMLIALGVSLPKQIFAHGWILNKDNAKMSKSEGDVISPLDMKDKVGVDAFRYFLVREIHFGNDAPFSQELVINRVNNELANNLGNTLSRTSNLVHKYFSGLAPTVSSFSVESNQLKDQALMVANKVKIDIERMATSYALEHIVTLLNQTNQYLEQRAPWKTAKEDLVHAGETLYTALECVRIAATLLQPVMPQKTADILTVLNVADRSFTAASTWGVIEDNQEINKTQPIFPRIEAI